LKRKDGQAMNWTTLDTIHYGNSSKDLNLCNPESQFYRFKDGIPDLTSTSVEAELVSLASGAL